MAFNPAGALTLPPQRVAPPISNGRIGMMLLVGTETILFSSFIGAYLVLRGGSSSWPPAGTPMLTLGLASFNTAILLMSSILMVLARKGILFRHSRESGNPVQPLFRTPASAGVTISLVLGTLFLILQGVEFHQLYARGLTLQTGPYGAVFFSLVSCHGLHVIGGLAFLAVVLTQTLRADEASFAGMGERIGLAEMYWHFVTAVWLVLFAILYIL